MPTPDKLCVHPKVLIRDDPEVLCLGCDNVFNVFSLPPAEPESGVVWWEGAVSCPNCGFGTFGKVRGVIPIPAGQEGPSEPVRCPGCRKDTLAAV